MDEFDGQKRRSFLQVLFKAARLANESSLQRLRERSGQDWLRVSHTRLFPHIPFDGIRLTDLADRLGVSKQAVQVLVDDLTEAGMVDRVPDPEDGRAKLIRWSEQGRDGLRDGVGMLDELAAELIDVVGDDAFTTTHQTLLALVDHYEATSSLVLTD